MQPLQSLSKQNKAKQNERTTTKAEFYEKQENDPEIFTHQPLLEGEAAFQKIQENPEEIPVRTLPWSRPRGKVPLTKRESKEKWGKKQRASMLTHLGTIKTKACDSENVCVCVRVRVRERMREGFDCVS